MRFILNMVTACLTIIATQSCIKDGEELDDCRQYIRFVYDYNMSYANLFDKQATKMNLFLFGANGKYITTLQDEKSTFPPNYKMLIPENLPEGKYKVVAWSGLYTDSYKYSNLVVGQSTPDDLIVQVNDYAKGNVAFEMKPLWYGTGEIEVNKRKNDIKTISLVKDTKKFRIVMQNLEDDKAIDVNNYYFEVTAANGQYDYQNNISGNELIYTPYYTYNDKNAGAVAELNTLRLMTDVGNRLKITEKSSGRAILDVKLGKYLAALRLQQFKDIPYQEYLDREDSFTMIFFFKNLDPEGSNISYDIKINGWLIREQGGDL